MKTGVAIKVVAGTFLLLIIWGWYSAAANYDYKAVSGIYSVRLNGEASTLFLKDNRSFQQELTREGRVEHAQGTWRRIGEGGVVFSKEFLTLSGQEVRADGQADGEIKKRIGLFLSIAFRPDVGGPVFKKKLLH